MTVTTIVPTSEKHEECGVFGVYSKRGKDVVPLIYRALMALQHRGQDAAGAAVYDGKKLRVKRGIGLVCEVFDRKNRNGGTKLSGHIGIGHTRYPTSGKCRMCDVQPMKLNSIAAAHNGHIANYSQVRAELEGTGYKFASSVDSEIMVSILDKNTEGCPKSENTDSAGGIVAAVTEMMQKLEGSFSVTAIVEDKLVAFRDPHAIRPLVWGENENFVCFASETVALDVNDMPYCGDVLGGEAIIADETGMNRKQILELPSGYSRHCMFEYVYFARPDSRIDGKSVYEVRGNLGVELSGDAPVCADVVIPVPDTSRNAAASYARKLGIPCEEGLIKNRYVGRTFIMPNQQKRTDAVRLKLNPVREIVNGKSVVLVDDSIVRGTTLKEIVGLVRKAGAREVHLRITCPPVRAPCFYGVDMSTYSELIANKKTVDEIREYFGADSLAYISMRGLKNAIGLPICTACLNEEYLSEYAKKLAGKIKSGHDVF